MPSNCEPGLQRECKLLLKAGDNCDIFLYRAVIESGLESSVLRWYCYHSMPAGCTGWGRGGGKKVGGESEMWSRYNGVLHRSAQNYWPLSRFSMFPSHPPQHPALISSPSGRGGFPGRAELQPRFTPSVPPSCAAVCSDGGRDSGVSVENRKWPSNEMRRRRIKWASGFWARSSLWQFSPYQQFCRLSPSLYFPISFAFHNLDID